MQGHETRDGKMDRYVMVLLFGVEYVIITN